MKESPATNVEFAKWCISEKAVYQILFKPMCTYTEKINKINIFIKTLKGGSAAVYGGWGVSQLSDIEKVSWEYGPNIFSFFSLTLCYKILFHFMERNHVP